MKQTLLIVLGAALVGAISCQTVNRNAGKSLRDPSGSAAIRPGFVALDGLDASKKTVCAMTLNSDNEVRAFQRRLSPSQFQFVELVDDGPGWLEKAIEAKVKCDILIVSGHFGGTFFGENGRLSLTELENGTCSPGGAGIFHSAKEVFLFGCNTLAGKAPDRRTPEEYIQVLLADNFTRAQAEQIAAFRYSPLGNTFSDRMSRVFAGVPRVYGFTSVGPAGSTVEPLLEKYLKNIDYLSYLDTVDLNPNTKFLKALENTAVDQTAGVAFSKMDFIPRCILNDITVGESKKLQLVDQLLMDPDKRLSHLGEIGDYLIHSTRTGANRDLETKLAQRWAADTSLQTDMRKILDEGIKSYPLLRLQMTDIGSYFGWLNSRDVSRIANETVRDFFKDGLTRNEADALSSLGDAAGKYITYDLVKNQPLNENLLDVLGETHTKDAKIHWMLVNAMKSDPESNVRMRAGIALINIGLQDEKILQAILDILKNDYDLYTRANAATLLGFFKPTNPQIQSALTDIIKNQQEEYYLRIESFRALERIKPQNPTILKEMEIFRGTFF